MVKRKHVLLIGLIMGVVVLSPLSASDDLDMLGALGITPFSEDTIVTVDGIDFNIPKGYGENEDMRIEGEIDEINDINFITFSREYMNNNADMIFITVDYDGQQMMDSNMLSMTVDGEDKTINDIDGIFSKNDDLYSFDYCKDGKRISVTANDESILKEILISK